VELEQTDWDVFVGLLNAEIYRASRYSSPVTLIRIELKRPTRHAVRTLDQYLCERTRLIDFGLAIGESEFLLCLPYTDIGGADAVARRIGHAMEEFEPVSTIAKFPENGETLFELFSAVHASREARSALINLEDQASPDPR